MDIACALVSAQIYENRHLCRSDTTAPRFTQIFSHYMLQLTVFRRNALIERRLYLKFMFLT